MNTEGVNVLDIRGYLCDVCSTMFIYSFLPVI